MNLQRMIVVPAHTFEKWKKIVIQDEKMTDLDKNMKQILHNSNLNDLSKWQLYRQNLMRFANSKGLFDKAVLNHSIFKSENNREFKDAQTETNNTTKQKKIHKQIILL